MSALLVMLRDVVVEYRSDSRMSSMKKADDLRETRVASDAAVMKLARFWGRSGEVVSRREMRSWVARGERVLGAGGLVVVVFVGGCCSSGLKNEFVVVVLWSVCDAMAASESAFGFEVEGEGVVVVGSGRR